MTVRCRVCEGRGFVQAADGWPTECPECVPTKLVRGRVVLDSKLIAERARQAAPKRIPEIAPKRYVGQGTTHYFAVDTE